MKLYQLCQVFLGYALPHPFAADVGTEGFQLLLLWLVKHAVLGRILVLTPTAHQGVKYTHDEIAIQTQLFTQ